MSSDIHHTLIIRHHVECIFCTGTCAGWMQSCQICQVFDSYIKQVLGGLVKGWSIWRIWLLCNGSHGHPECVVYSPALVYVGLLKRLWWMWYLPGPHGACWPRQDLWPPLRAGTELLPAARRVLPSVPGGQKHGRGVRAYFFNVTRYESIGSSLGIEWELIWAWVSEVLILDQVLIIDIES